MSRVTRARALTGEGYRQPLPFSEAAADLFRYLTKSKNDNFEFIVKIVNTFYLNWSLQYFLQQILKRGKKSVLKHQLH